MGAEPERVRTSLAALLLAFVLTPVWAAAQDPTPPVADTVAPLPADSLARVPPAPRDTAAITDTLPSFHNLPALDEPMPAGWATGIWVWTHAELMESGANTLVELFDDVPGMVPLPAGDYGTPAAVSAFGLGAGGVRVIRDGFELLPLEGGVVDLQRVGLGGIGRVRLRRDGGQVVVEMSSLDHDDSRPFSLVEAGTGDLDNNLFRGTFTAPNALRGSLGLALERSDSRGSGPNETGSRTGTWLRYQLHRGDAAGLALDFRRMGSRSEVAAYPSPVTRTDFAVRARARLADGVTAELYTGKSTHDVEDERSLYATEGGSTSQHGIRLDAARRGFWLDGAFRLYRGDDLAENRLDLSGGWVRDGVGGVRGHFARADWVGAEPNSLGVSAWVEPVRGVQLFGSWDSGEYGARSGPALEIAPPAVGPDDPVPPEWADRTPASVWITERTTYRAGAALTVRGVTLSAAALGLEHDLSLPLALPSDAESGPVPGDTRRGWEAYTSVRLPIDGLRFVGAYQEWDRPGPYLPARIYRGGLEFRRTYLGSGNFELYGALAVRGHDPMEVFDVDGDPGGSAGLATVPFFQSWDARIQIRIVTVRIFVSWENASVRRDLQAFPGRVLFPLRTSYGIRWTMRN
jgi:hypothetical protein